MGGIKIEFSTKKQNTTKDEKKSQALLWSHLILLTSKKSDGNLKNNLTSGHLIKVFEKVIAGNALKKGKTSGEYKKIHTNLFGKNLQRLLPKLAFNFKDKPCDYTKSDKTT